MRRLFIFDLDGTLLDSRDSILQSIRFAFGQLGLPDILFDEVRAVQQDLATTLRQCSEKAGIQIEETQIQEFIAVYRKHHSLDPATTMRPYEGIPQILVKLQEDFELAVATTKHTEQAEHILKAVGLRHSFDFVQGTDSGLRYKPEPDILNAVLHRLERQAGESIYFGDSSHDMEAAHSAGMLGIGATYGFGGREALASSRAHQLISEPSEILDIAHTHGSRAEFSLYRRPNALRKRSAWTAAQLAVQQQRGI